MEIMLTLLTLNNYEWTKSDDLITALRAPMLRLCARYKYGIRKTLNFVSEAVHDHIVRKKLQWLKLESDNVVSFVSPSFLVVDFLASIKLSYNS